MRKLIPLSLLLIAITLIYIDCSKMRIHHDLLTNGNIPDWPMYGRDVQRTNYYPNTVSPPFKLKWLIKATSALDKNMIVTDGILYFTTLDGKVEAMHLETGEKIGSKKLEDASTCAFSNYHLIIAKRYGDKTLFNLNLIKSKYIWRIDAGDIASEPLVTPNSIIIAALYNHLDLYSFESGIKIWSFETDDQIRSSPAMNLHKIVFGCDNGYVYCLDASDGKLIWKFAANNSVQSTPTINMKDKIVYFGSCDQNFYAVNFENGAELWRFKANGSILQGAAFYNNFVVFGSTDRNLYCLNAKSGKLIWKFSANSIMSTSPIIANDVVYGGSLDHHFYALNLNDGSEIWKYKAKGRIRTNPIVWGDYFICASEDNFIYVFEIDDNGDIDVDEK